MNSKIDTTNWKEFRLKDIFKFKKGKCSNSPDLEEGCDLPYIGAKKEENGVMKWVKKEKHLVSKKNCISFICQGAGSNGFNNYFDIDTIQSTSNVLGYNENLNEFNGLFIVTVLDLERPKWSFGRGRAPKLADTIIKLPSDLSGNPDWKYMENYIKSLREREREREIDEISESFLEKNTLIFYPSNWKEFKLNDIFNFPKIKKYSKIPESKGLIPFVSSSSKNNSVVGFVDEKPINIKNVISITTNGEGFIAKYQEKFCCYSSDSEIITSVNLNKYSAMFIISILSRESYRYSFMRKPKNNKINNSVIKLPSDVNGNPDWDLWKNI